MSTVLAAVLIGLAVGVVVGALGAGGGILSVPILVYALGQHPHSATASSLVIVGSTAVAGLVHHVRRRTVDWGNGVIFGLLGVAGSVVGSRLSVQLDGRVLLGLFAGLLALVAIAMFRSALISRRGPVREPSGTLHRRAEVAAHHCAGHPDQAAHRPVRRRRRVHRGPDPGAGAQGADRTAAGTSLVVMVIASISGLLSRIGTG